MLTSISSLLKVPMTNRTFGVEIETVGYPLDPLFARATNMGLKTSLVDNWNDHLPGTWGFKDDCSLWCELCRHLTPGEKLYCKHRAEVISPILSGEEGIRDLHRTLEVLTAIGVSTNESCGLHVHVGAQDFEGDANNLMRVQARYYGLGLNQLAGRESSYYALHLETREEQMEYSRDAAKNNCIDRYMAVNFDSLSIHTTIEFRQHVATLDFNRIDFWVRAVTHLVDEVAAVRVCANCSSTTHNAKLCRGCNDVVCNDHKVECPGCLARVCPRVPHDIFHCGICYDDQCSHSNHRSKDCEECGQEMCPSKENEHNLYCRIHQDTYCGTQCPDCNDLDC